MKIWNLNKCTGVLGVFNCQGAGTWPCLEIEAKGDLSSELSGQVSPADVEYFEEVSGKLWTGDCAVFAYSTGTVIFATLHLSTYNLCQKNHTTTFILCI